MMLWSPADMQTVGSGKCARDSSGHQQACTRVDCLLSHNNPAEGLLFVQISTGEPNETKQALLELRSVA